MKPITREWVAKAEGDFRSAQREVRFEHPRPADTRRRAGERQRCDEDRVSVAGSAHRRLGADADLSAQCPIAVVERIRFQPPAASHRNERNSFSGC